MNRRSPALVGGLAVVSVWLALASGPVAHAQGADDAVHDAGRHFQRGVTLYGEADYRGALVEFRRAYELSPNGAVLYNIGETEFQLRDYAGALTTFDRYLAESGEGDRHRVEVESSVRELRARVGRITISTVPRGADVTIDDRVVGRTPLDHPVVVGLGRVRVTATMAGHVSVSRELDVAAEDDVSVQLQLPLAMAPGSALSLPGADPEDATPSSGVSGSWRTAGWITSAVLGAGAIGMGVLALREGAELRSQRDLYVQDASPQAELDRRNHLNHLSNLTRTYSIVADSMGAAAVVVGAITLLSSLSASGGEAATSAAQISVGPRAMNLRLTF